MNDKKPDQLIRFFYWLSFFISIEKTNSTYKNDRFHIFSVLAYA